jgi:hypothetical protein
MNQKKIPEDFIIEKKNDQIEYKPVDQLNRLTCMYELKVNDKKTDASVD